MTDMLHRYATDLELRSDGRTVHGILVPFEVEAEIVDARHSYRERFAYGSFTRSIAERGDRVKLLVNHNRQALPIGRATSLREDRVGLIGEFRISQTPDGDTALQLVRDGVVDAFSIGFLPVRDRRDGDVVVRTEAALREVSLVGFPAYEGALVAGVRHSTPTTTPFRNVAAARLALARAQQIGL